MRNARFPDRYQEILEWQSELICRYMPDGRLSYVNEAYSRYFRKDRSELLNRNFFPHVPSEDLPAIRQRIASLKQGNTVVDLEHRVILPDGEVRWQCWTHSAILDPKGEIVEYQAVGRDITTQKLRERHDEELISSIRQRLKEVNCLYAITEVLTATHLSLAQVCQAVVDLLPNAFQYPEIACARLVLLEQDFHTNNYADGAWRQTIDIIVQGEWLGFIEISYLEDRPLLDSGPFLMEESVLLQEIVKRLHQVVGRQRAEEELREREAESHRIFDDAPDALLIIGAEDRILRGNAQACAMFRLSPEAIAGLPMCELADPSSAQEFAAFSGIEKSGGQRLETRCRCADGSVIDVEIAAHRCEAGGNPYVLAAIRDISARKQTEETLRRSEEDFARFSGCLEHLVEKRTMQVEKVGRAFLHEKSVRRATQLALQESESRLRDVFDGMNNGGWILEPRGVDMVFVDFNCAAQRLEKVTRAEVLGRRLQETFPWIGEHGLDKVLKRVRERGVSEHCAVTFRRDGVAYAWREFHLFPIPSGEVVVSYEDVSARKKVEVELRQAQKTEAIGQLAGGIAHDFNNILTGILGYAELLESGFAGRLPAAVEPLTGLRYVRELINAGIRARDLVQQILTFSRRSNAEKKIIRLPPLVKEIVKFLRASLPASVTINCRVDGVEATVVAEPTQIHQIVMNLCGNAADALRGGCGIIEISLEKICCRQPGRDEHEAHCEQLLLKVRDDGQGMNSEVLERIFEPYFTTKPVGEGTGIGLSVVLGIVESIGGRIEVESAVGRGSEFRVYLPSVGRGVAKAQDEAPVPVLQGSGCLLLVDDEVAIVESGRRRLELAGFAVLTAASGPEALELFRLTPERIDIVITDESMPGMPGSELAAHLRAIRPALPIILCSGYETCATADKVRALGIDAFLRKPFTAQELAAAIQIAQARVSKTVDAATGALARRGERTTAAARDGTPYSQGEVDHGMPIF